MLQDLYTREGEALQGAPWQSYPRPQLKRNSYVNLNGQWDFTVTPKGVFPEAFDRKFLVPFCPESLLSGLHRHFPDGDTLCYRKIFALPADFCRGRVLLHFGAVDQTAEVYLNGKALYSHVGGYESFTVDITEALEEENELIVLATDDLRSTVLPYGKQTLKRGGMWYTPVSGIWQTVWLESVPQNYIQSLDIRATTDTVTITITPALEGAVNTDGKRYLLRDGTVTFRVEDPRLWSPEEPNLYPFTVTTEEDRVESYFALRTIEIGEVNGIPKLLLNGKPYFFHGLLDQGYWSDGIYTPADPVCYENDIREMKKLGFNTLRKHIKVEPEEFYYQCDKLGMVVFQDMVNNGDYSFFRDTLLPTVGIQKTKDTDLHPDPETRSAFLGSMAATVRQLKNHPCILYWTIFNEGWGQFDSENVYDMLKALDDTRIIDATSGWFRQKKSDVDSRHIYFSPWSTLKVSDKPMVLSEFGGYAYPVEGHLFNPEKAYGYKSCKSEADFRQSVEKLYLEKVLRAVKKGLCAAIITQVSDVEDEINGFLTYDRKVNKADEKQMQRIAQLLKEAME